LCQYVLAFYPLYSRADSTGFADTHLKCHIFQEIWAPTRPPPPPPQKKNLAAGVGKKKKKKYIFFYICTNVDQCLIGINVTSGLFAKW